MEGFLSVLSANMSVYLQTDHNQSEIISTQLQDIDSFFSTDSTLCMFEVQNKRDGIKKCNTSFSEAFSDILDHYGVFHVEVGESINKFKCDEVYDSTYVLGIIKSTFSWLIPKNIHQTYQTKNGIIDPSHNSDTNESWNYIYNVFSIMSKYNSSIREYNGQLYYIVIDSSIVGARKQFADFVNTFVKASTEIDNAEYLSLTDQSFEVPYDNDVNSIGNRIKYFIVNVPAYITTETIHVGEIKQEYDELNVHIPTSLPITMPRHIQTTIIGWKTSCQHCGQNNTIPHFVIKNPKQHKEHLMCQECSKQMINYGRCDTHNIYYYKSANKHYNSCPKCK
jgi:hypothetical protein